MQEVLALLEGLQAQNVLVETVNFPKLQLGPKARNYYFSRILPEKRVLRNEYREEEISYKTVMANSGTRYSPVTLKAGARVGSFLVELGHSDTGSEYTGQAFDALVDKLGQNNVDSMEQAETEIINFTDRTIGRSLAEYREKQRCDAIVDATILREGFNGYKEIVQVPNPTGHRVIVPSGTKSSPQGWYNSAYDPMEDIIGMVTYLRVVKGLIATRFVSSMKIKMLLARHPRVQAYGNGVTVVQGQLQGSGPNGSGMTVDMALAKNDLPPLDTYDLRYWLPDGTNQRFMRDTAFVVLCQTGRDQAIDLGDEEPIPLYDTMGYTAIGRPVGEAQPGVTVRSTFKNDKPPRIELEGWQTSLPVLQDPEAIAVLTIPDPT